MEFGKTGGKQYEKETFGPDAYRRSGNVSAGRLRRFIRRHDDYGYYDNRRYSSDRGYGRS